MKYLFERLVQRQDVAGPVPFDLKTAVRDNVQRILTNRVINEEESTPDVLRCGLPSVVDLPRDGRTALEEYSTRVDALIRHYEPRLVDPIAQVEGGGSVPMRIVVSAKLARPDGMEEMRFSVATRIEE